MASIEPDSRYYFVLRDGQGRRTVYPDEDVSGEDHAIEAGIAVAKELMRNQELATRHWQLRIYEANGHLVKEIRFSEIDETVQHLTAELRASLIRVCDKKLELQEAMHASSVLRQQSRILIAQSRKKPNLVVCNS